MSWIGSKAGSRLAAQTALLEACDWDEQILEQVESAICQALGEKPRSRADFEHALRRRLPSTYEGGIVTIVELVAEEISAGVVEEVDEIC